MNKSTLRRLVLEDLEIRRCFAIDVGMPEPNLEAPIEILRHNVKIPTDVNQDGITSPLDALGIINELNQSQASPNSGMMSDTNGDGRISPLDVLIVINRLNNNSSSPVIPLSTEVDDSTVLTESLQNDLEPETENTVDADLINDTIADWQANQEGIATLLARLQDLGIINLGSFDPNSFDWDALDLGSHDTGSLDSDLLDQAMNDLGSLDLGSLDLGSFDLDALDLGFDLGMFTTGSLDVGGVDVDLLGRLGGTTPASGGTYNPTDDNGNNFFLTDEEANALSNTIEAELRTQLNLEESASIQVAVFANDAEVRSGTWRYLTEEGISIWGNWRQSDNELRLFLSNVEEENRIYGQYPDGSFLYFSWLEQEPVGFYFTPLSTDAVENPVPTERYTDYFESVGGEVTNVNSASLSAIFGDLGSFAGVQPIENLLRDLYAIQLQWNADLAANA